MKVCVKWGKNKYDLELDVTKPPLELKKELFKLTNVPVERQKIMLKGQRIKDDAEWGNLKIKDGQQLMMMGSAETVEEPQEKTVFLEDLTEEQANEMVQTKIPPGLINLGNTCYLNSTVQCLRAIPELCEFLKKYDSSFNDNHSKITTSAKTLVSQLESSKNPVAPTTFLQEFRTFFPRFAEKGSNGLPMQQDAEEFLTSLLSVLSQKLTGGSNQNSAIHQLFYGEMITRYRLLEGEEDETSKVDRFEKLKCPISKEISNLNYGLKQSMEEEIEKNSVTLGRSARYHQSSRITKLPFYLTIQFARFHWKIGSQTKAKIVKPVEFPFILDIYDLCDQQLQDSLKLNREKLFEGENSKEEKDVHMEDVKDLESITFHNNTAKYELFAVVSHKGRTADSGHYIAWIKEKEDSWIIFDDDRVKLCNNEDIAKLSGKGGADWHMAYILFYRSIQLKE